ncbi:acyltransferase [Uliginosibacterium sp. TH139]|uniref:acyltransferase family protein n=1 Tax=Uliginosibacterium sp. TH139 TaxID=2067453 RepID=UPI000C7D3B16|nr:acyltransferase [Uliginosibacterium sp. TH139]PLK49198.1 hypothetical protein C0V76_08335 [Uliginosibacterium sp. TH139]
MHGPHKTHAVEHSRIPAIDGLRGASILLVVAGHLMAWRFAGQLPLLIVQLGIFLSHLGVMLFFTISGFVITRRALTQYRQGFFSVKFFYFRRAVRILPAFIVYLLTIAILSLLGWIDQAPSGLIKAASFSCNLFNDCDWFAGHSWTLAYEWQFYLAFPALLLVFRRYMPIALMLIALIALVVVALEAVQSDAQSISFIAAGCVAAFFFEHLNTLFNTTFLQQAKNATSIPFLQFFGKISYSLYLWQQLCTAPPAKYQTESLLLLPVFLLPLAYISYRYVEKTTGDWFKRKRSEPLLKQS